MKPEKNVQARKCRDYPLGKPSKSSTKSTFSTPLRGQGGELTPFEYLESPVGPDERLSIEVPGNQESHT